MAATVARVMAAGADDAPMEDAYRAGRRTAAAYEIQKDTQIPFGEGRGYVENMMGQSGSLVKEWSNEFGDPLQEVQSRMEADLGPGTPMEADQGVPYGWEDGVYHKYYSLDPAGENSYLISVVSLSLGKETLADYDLSQGFGSLDVQQENSRKVLDVAEKVVYPDDYPLIRLHLYTDGKGYSTGYTSAGTADDNSVMEYALDLDDAIDEKGTYREYGKTVRTAVHEYGHVVSLNAGQVDMAKQDPSMPSVFYSQETFAPDAYMHAYYEKFWEGPDVKSGLERYRQHPDEFVSEYASNNMSEDFAESFMLFVLSSEPGDDSIASRKIRFFYGYDEMVKRRGFIRGNLAIEETSGRVAPEAAAGTYRVALDGNPTTGYQWHYSVEPEGIVSEAYSGYFQNYRDTDLVGAGGTYLFDFKGEKEGTANVTFFYSRPWESKTPTGKKVFRLTVAPDKTVTGEEAE